MAMFDSLLQLCNGKEIKTAFNTDAIDFRQAHPTTGAGAQPLYLNLVFPEDGAGTGSVTFALQDSANGSDDWKDVTSITIVGTDCKGTAPRAMALPITHRRYLRLATTLSQSAAITKGKVTAFINDGYGLPIQDKKQGVEFFKDATVD